MTERIVVSISGGKDSAAMALLLQEQGYAFELVFADTGWEHDDTYRYIDEVLEPRFGHVTRIKSTIGGMVQHVFDRGTFPSRLRRWCTDELKMRPVRDHIAQLVAEEAAGAGRTVVNAVGIRRAESERRAGTPLRARWTWGGPLDADVWFPIVEWSEEQVIEMHRRHALPPNPLYLRGARRVGCFPCIYAQKLDVALLAAEDPDRAATVRSLEAALSAQARVNAYRAGSDPLEQRHQRTFFGPGEKGRGWDDYGIDAHLRWATTDGKRAKAIDLEAEAADARRRWGEE